MGRHPFSRLQGTHPLHWFFTSEFTMPEEESEEEEVDPAEIDQELEELQKDLEDQGPVLE